MFNIECLRVKNYEVYDIMCLFVDVKCLKGVVGLIMWLYIRIIKYSLNI